MSKLHRYAGLLVVALSAGGCAAASTIGTLGTIASTVGLPSPGERQSQIAGEIRAFNADDQRIQLTTHEGQPAELRFDQNTEVEHRQQPYPLTSLQRGDLIVVHARQGAQGQLFADRIFVQHRADERPEHGAAVRQFIGRVASIDQERGEFVLRTAQDEVTVALPFNAPQATVAFFRRLRAGDTVSLEAVPVAAGRVEIHRFL